MSIAFARARSARRSSGRAVAGRCPERSLELRTQRRPLALVDAERRRAFGRLPEQILGDASRAAPMASRLGRRPGACGEAGRRHRRRAAKAALAAKAATAWRRLQRLVSVNALLRQLGGKAPVRLDQIRQLPSTPVIRTRSPGAAGPAARAPFAVADAHAAAMVVDRLDDLDAAADEARGAAR